MWSMPGDTQFRPLLVAHVGGELGAHRRYGIRVNGPHPPVFVDAVGGQNGVAVGLIGFSLQKFAPETGGPRLPIPLPAAPPFSTPSSRVFPGQGWMNTTIVGFHPVGPTVADDAGTPTM